MSFIPLGEYGAKKAPFQATQVHNAMKREGNYSTQTGWSWFEHCEESRGLTYSWAWLRRQITQKLKNYLGVEFEVRDQGSPEFPLSHRSSSSIVDTSTCSSTLHFHVLPPGFPSHISWLLGRAEWQLIRYREPVENWEQIDLVLEQRTKDSADLTRLVYFKSRDSESRPSSSTFPGLACLPSWRLLTWSHTENMPLNVCPAGGDLSCCQVDPSWPLWVVRTLFFPGSLLPLLLRQGVPEPGPI